MLKLRNCTPDYINIFSEFSKRNTHTHTQRHTYIHTEQQEPFSYPKVDLLYILFTKDTGSYFFFNYYYFSHLQKKTKIQKAGLKLSTTYVVFCGYPQMLTKHHGNPCQDSVLIALKQFSFVFFLYKISTSSIILLVPSSALTLTFF